MGVERGFWVALAKSYGLTADDAELFIETGLGIKRETAQAILREVLQGVPVTTLARIDATAIAIAGEKDSRTVWRDSLTALEPHAGVAIAPGMHHQWNIEDAELFNQSLRVWLTSGEAASSLRTRI
mgnify:CR=1 FL=1